MEEGIFNFVQLTPPFVLFSNSVFAAKYIISEFTGSIAISLITNEFLPISTISHVYQPSRVLKTYPEPAPVNAKIV